MARIAEPYNVVKRGKTFQITLNSTCGLPRRVCAEWQRRSFKTLPDELFNYRNPKTKSEARASVQILIVFLKKKVDTGDSARRVIAEDITVGNWLKKFISIDTSPRTGINIAENGSCSEGTILAYESYFKCHIEGDPMLHDKGIPLKHIQDLLGHANMKVTKRYTHLLEKTMRDINKKIIDTQNAAEEHKNETVPQILDFKVS